MIAECDAERLQITAELNRLIRTGRPFTVDRIWDRCHDISPARHRSWLGRQDKLGTAR